MAIKALGSLVLDYTSPCSLGEEHLSALCSSDVRTAMRIVLCGCFHVSRDTLLDALIAFSEMSLG